MKKIIAIIVALTFLLTISISTSVIAVPTIWYVDDSGGADFETISEAIGNANPGDTIIVRAGSYDEQLGISINNITLTGEAGAILESSGYEMGSNEPVAIYIAPDTSGVTIEGFSFCNYRSAIVLDGSSGNLIQHNMLLDNEDGDAYSFYDGINLANAYNNQIIGNTVTDCEIDGIWLGRQSEENETGSNNNFIIGNTISGCHGGIILDSSHYNKVTNNNISDSLSEPDHGCGIFIGVGATYNLVSKNQVSNCGGGINLGNACFNQILNNEVINSDTGICMGPDQTETGPSNNTVSNNTINGCGDGIWLMDAEDNSIVENTIERSTIGGIFLGKEQSESGSTGNIVSANVITNIQGNGINLDGADSNNITGNKISNSGKDGISIVGSLNNTIKENKVTYSGKHGIVLLNNANGNNVLENSIAFSTVGIAAIDSTNNTIKENKVSHSIKVDLFDNNYQSSSNTWKDNKFKTSNF